MNSISKPRASTLTRLWRRNPPLLAVSLAMAALVPILFAALWLDPRVLNGEALWIKPIKFAVSIALYSLTLLWMLESVAGSDRLRRWMRTGGWVIAVVFVVEMIAIVGQAARGRMSHFNNSTLEDALIFNLMGAAITTLFVVHLIITAILLRQTDGDDQVLASALRSGLAVSAMGIAVGFLMTSPTAEQLAVFTQGLVPERIGAHTVGAPDGGPGIPLTGWSATAGDLRVPHFFGMHAMQVLPLFALWLRRKPDGDSKRRRAFVRIAAVGYAAMTGLLTLQALRGQSILQPDAQTIAGFALIIVGCACAALYRWSGRFALRGRNAQASHI